MGSPNIYELEGVAGSAIRWIFSCWYASAIDTVQCNFYFKWFKWKKPSKERAFHTD